MQNEKLHRFLPDEPDDGFCPDISEKRASHRYGHGDEALRAVLSADPLTLDEATNRRLKRKIDMMLMPLLCVIYGLNFLDKVTLSYASVTGIQKDLGLKGNQYAWLGSIFYLGYLGFEYPAAWLLQSMPLAKYSGFMIIAWGLVLTCFAAVKSFAGAVLVRLVLGICEASVSPGWTLFTSQWYTKDEQATRTAWWVSANGWAQIFGGLVAYGVAHAAETHGFSIAPWKVIFLLTGLLTIVVGIVFLIIVPDNQLNAWWLSKEDRILAVERVRKNQQGIGNKHFKVYQLKEALTDPKTWAFCLLALAGDIPNGGLTNFFNLLIESFDYTAQESLLYGCVSGAIEIVILLGWALLVAKFGNRVLWGFLGMLVALLGSILLVALPLSDNKGRLAGFYLAQFFVIALVVVVSMLSTNIAGYTKKTAVAAFFFICYCAGNIIGPQTFRATDQPRYIPAEITLIVCYSLCALDLAFLYWYLKHENESKAVKRADPSYKRLDNQEFLDLTDRENPEFMYVT